MISVTTDSRRRRRIPTAPVVAVVVLALAAWAALAAWGASPHARYLDHASLDDPGLEGPALAGVMIGGWTLMVVAMMLPTALPLVRMVGDVGRRRDQRGYLTAALVTGYLSVWVGVGGLAWGGDAVLHALEDVFPVVEANAWLLAPASLALAAGFQLSSVKDRCLRECRSPRGLLMQRWRGRQPGWEAWALGVEHGKFCVGCCWALMLVMFAVGGGNLGIMLALGALMAAEKNFPGGAALTRPLALVLALAAVGTLVVGP
ncbi:MAG: DUF2182 domain-containing protein [Acidimicrobiia bacterium]|nr:DUF2182 domain-containing protein [Acidimicrobiia bacterium]